MPITPLNMHKDLVVTRGAPGTVVLTGRDTDGQRQRVAISDDVAQQINAVPSDSPTPHHQVTPFNMHKDGPVQVDQPDQGSVVITGPATSGADSVQLQLTIDGEARHALRNGASGI